jgi:hypothetical protein
MTIIMCASPHISIMGAIRRSGSNLLSLVHSQGLFPPTHVSLTFRSPADSSYYQNHSQKRHILYRYYRSQGRFQVFPLPHLQIFSTRSMTSIFTIFTSWTAIRNINSMVIHQICLHSRWRLPSILCRVPGTVRTRVHAYARRSTWNHRRSHSGDNPFPKQD